MYGAAFRRKRFNSALRKTYYCSHAHSFAMLLTYLGAGDIPPGSTPEAVAAALVIACVTTLFLLLVLSINILHSVKLPPAHSIQKLDQCQNQINLL